MEEIFKNFFDTYDSGTIILVLILILIIAEGVKIANYWRTINNITKIKENTETNNKLLVELINKLDKIDS